MDEDMFEELKNMFEGLLPDADKLNLEEMQRRLGLIRSKTANDHWGKIMARAGPYHRGGGARTCSLRQLQKTPGGWGCFRICRSSNVRRFRPRKM